MSIRISASLVILVAACGCRMCSDNCDYSSPVAGGPYAGVQGRAGSISNYGGVYSAPPSSTTEPSEPAPPAITQPPAVAPPVLSGLPPQPTYQPAQ